MSLHSAQLRPFFTANSMNRATTIVISLHMSRQTYNTAEPRPIIFARDSIYAKRAYAIAIPSVCLSVRLSVTRVIHAKTVVARIVQFSPYSSPIPLVFDRRVSSRNSKGFPLNGGVKQGWGRKNSQFPANNSPYLRNGAR